MAKNVMHDDQKYIRGLAANDTSVITTIYDKFVPDVIDAIKQRQGDVYDAQDVVQATIIDLYFQAREKDLKLACSFDAYFSLLCQLKWLEQVIASHNKPNSDEAQNISLADLNDQKNTLITDPKYSDAFQVYSDISAHAPYRDVNEQETLDFKANLDVISSMHFNTSEANQISIAAPSKGCFFNYGIAIALILLLGVIVYK